MQKRPRSPTLAERLGLPAVHGLSLDIASQIAALSLSLPEGVRMAKVISPGLVELLLDSGSGTGYGLRQWPLRIGGAGLGDDAETAAMIGSTDPRSPLLVRFAVPIAMHGVDDTGCCDASFWEHGLREDVSLFAIAARALQWLRGGQFAAEVDGAGVEENDGEQPKWLEAEGHEGGKISVVQQYRSIAVHDKLVNAAGYYSHHLLITRVVSLSVL